MQAGNSIVLYDPNIAIQQAQAAKSIVSAMRSSVLRKDVDYGVIPGTGNKEVLLKPGAERLCSAFGFAPEFELVSKVEEWNTDHPIFNYQYRCRLIHIETGKTIATGIGSCNSMEKKYRWRDAQRTCPTCGKATILKSKDKPEFFCWRKKGGCGATFPDNDQRILGQPEGQIENPDIYDQVNTIDKMAQKRALVAASLIGCNASEFFTQDEEDQIVRDDVIEADIVEDTPKTIDHRAWYQIPEERGKFGVWLHNRYDFTIEDAEKLLGKSISSFNNGKIACEAVIAAMEKPAEPTKSTQPQSTSEPVNKHWLDIPAEYDQLHAYLNAFDVSLSEFESAAPDVKWVNFATLNEALEAVRKVAIEKKWPMLATKVEYRSVKNPLGAERHIIEFNTPIPLTWYKGRNELHKFMVATQSTADWLSIIQWEPGWHDLPEKVRITWNINGDRYEIVSLESADAKPF